MLTMIHDGDGSAVRVAWIVYKMMKLITIVVCICYD
jgi:hypothetical protein